jgi:hypothetical protein
VPDPLNFLIHVDGKEFSTLTGYYIRVPEPVSEAFGKRLEAESSIEIIWFVNTIVYMIYYDQSSILQINVTLEKAVACSDSPNVAGHVGVQQHVFTYQGYNANPPMNFHYLPIPATLESNFVPTSVSKKLRIGPKLVNFLEHDWEGSSET